MMPSRLVARLVTTVLAWAIAFLTVLALLTLFGDQLSSLPLALRALVISGLLVFLMANLVMPVAGRAISHWLEEAMPPGRPRPR
jgi:antibiotic biosynthesis monooxygenase (ABM) superfamily enzyme